MKTVLKTHKEGTPFLPILSMTGSSLHELGWTITTCVGTVFVTLHIRFVYLAKTMQNFDIDPNVFMCSYDVSSLFINVPPEKNIKICLEALYEESDSQPVNSKNVFVELMKSATS